MLKFEKHPIKIRNPLYAYFEFSPIFLVNKSSNLALIVALVFFFVRLNMSFDVKLSWNRHKIWNSFEKQFEKNSFALRKICLVY